MILDEWQYELATAMQAHGRLVGTHPTIDDQYLVTRAPLVPLRHEDDKEQEEQ